MRRAIVLSVLLCLLVQTALSQTFMISTKTILGENTLMSDSEIYQRDTLENARYIIKYKNRIRVGTDYSSYFEEEYVLLKGDRFSKYQPLNKYLYDNNVASNDIIAGVGNLLNTHYAFCYDALYSDSETGEMEVAGRLFQDDFLYKEQTPTQNWVITDSIREINGLSCRKAYTEFRGRKYTAWFTDEIPLSFGPWKLRGLPGLIVFAYDATGQYSFTLDGLGETDAVIVKPRYNYSKVSRKIFNKFQSQYVNNPTLYKMSHSGPGISVDPSKGRRESEIEYDILEID